MRKVKVMRGFTELFGEAEEAVGFFERLRGLTKATELADGYCLAFARCPRIHCHGMRIPIDVITLTDTGLVIDARTVEPGKLGPKLGGAYWALECRAGRAAELGIEKWQSLQILPR